MSKVLSDIPVDAGFIKDIITTHGSVEAIEFMRKCFTDDMNLSIKDKNLRLMVWQITHSLEVLAEKTNRSFWTLADVEHIVSTTEDKDTLTTARHIIDALDNLTLYVES